MKALKILVVITALVVITGVISDAWAGCSPARLFRSQGKPNNTANVKWDQTCVPPGTHNVDKMIGRLWDSDDANNSNNGLTDVVGDCTGFGSLCPPSVWWLPQGNPPTNRIIDGFHGGTGCAASGCPADNLTIVVEDYDVNGPPGIGGTAYWLGVMVYETPASDRWWDYGLVDGVTANTTFCMYPFPPVDILVSARLPIGDVVIQYRHLDQSNNMHSWNVPAGAPFPNTRILTEWQLVEAVGGDPGRCRSAGWTTVATTPYVDGGSVPFQYTVDCHTLGPTVNKYLAVGMGFNGGAYGVIDSGLVGPAIKVECDPFLADPDVPVGADREPSAIELENKPGRSGGRR